MELWTFTRYVLYSAFGVFPTGYNRGECGRSCVFVNMLWPLPYATSSTMTIYVSFLRLVSSVPRGTKDARTRVHFCLKHPSMYRHTYLFHMICLHASIPPLRHVSTIPSCRHLLGKPPFPRNPPPPLPSRDFNNGTIHTHQIQVSRGSRGDRFRDSFQPAHR